MTMYKPEPFSLSTRRARGPIDAELANRRHNLLIGTAVGLPALLYLLFVSHYSVDVPWSVDDWSIIAFVSRSVHGHLDIGSLWSQYGDRRPFLGRLIFVAFGSIDHLNEKSVMLFSGVIFVASFVLLLLTFRSHLRTRLTFFRVLGLGIVWFSVADYLNALWSFQLSWYLVVFFLVSMMYLLLVPKSRRNLTFGLGVLAAVAGSLSDVQGLSLWLVGLVCLIWTQPRGRRMYAEIALWLSASTVTCATYFTDYRFANTQCVPASRCSLGYELQHPLLLTSNSRCL